MKKILLIVSSLSQTNGVVAFVMNYLNYFNLDKISIDIMYNDIRTSQSNLDFFKKKNIGTYKLTYLKEVGVNGYIREIKKFFMEHKDYDLVYSNVSYLSYFFFKEAKKNGINNFLIHAHATQSSDNKLKNILGELIQKKVNKMANHKFACSKLAGRAMFKNDNFVVVNNAIDYGKYAFDNNCRNYIRDELKINNDEKIIGFIGRYAPQKNVFFFIELIKKLPDEYRVVMIGNGEQKKEFISKISKDGLEERFIILDEICNVNEYYSLFDYFFLPSVYEGLPIVGVEAQANGLPCIFSDTISKECKISNNTVYLDRNNVDSWIENMSKMKRNEDLKLNDDFNINVQAKKFEKLLSKIANE